MVSLVTALWTVLHGRTLLLGAVAFLFFAYFFRKRRPKNCPPGPSSLAILGNLFQVDFDKMILQMQQDWRLETPFTDEGYSFLSPSRETGLTQFFDYMKGCFIKNIHALWQKNLGQDAKGIKEKIEKLRPQIMLVKKYGNIIGMEFIGFYSVFITGLPMIKEALVEQGQHFMDRPVTPLRYHVFKKNGLVMSSGQTWKEQRRFTLTTLRNFGLGKKSLEERIQEEAYYLIQLIKEENGKPFDPHFKINNAVSNIICSITFGERFEYQDEKFQGLLRMLDEVVWLEASAWCQFYNMFPTLINLLPGPHRTLFNDWENLKLFVAEMIKNHKRDWNPDEPRDFIDAYLKEIEMHKGETSSSFDEENLIFTTLDLFTAGTETTSTTLRWALLYMALYPDIQEKVHTEIDRVIGQMQQPSMALRESMPYTHAVVHEVQRMGNIIPLNVPRAVVADTTLNGYHIPKGTMVLTNLTALHRDPAKWATPDTFNPEHFLENGQFKKREDFLPFSIGKRACLGEQLARTELFVFFTSLMQKFTFRAPENEQLSQKSRMGLTVAPVKYRICALPRV